MNQTTKYSRKLLQKSKLYTVILFSFFVSIHAFTQDGYLPPPEIDFVDLEAFEKLIERKIIIQNQGVRVQYEDKKRFKDFKNFVELEEVTKSDTFTCSIAADTKVYSLKDNKMFIVPKDIYARAHTQADTDGYIYLLNKENQITHKTHFSNAIPIKHITDMDAKPNSYVEYPPKKTLSKYDAPLKRSMDFIYGLDHVVSNYTADLLNDDRANRGIGHRLQFNYNLILDLPFEVGLNLAYQNTEFKYQDSKAQLNDLSVGPLVKSKPFQFKNYSVQVYTSANIGLLSKVKTKQNSYNLNMNNMALGFQIETKNKYGLFLLGANVRRNFLKPTSDNIVSIDDTNRNDDQFGITIGQEILW